MYQDLIRNELNEAARQYQGNRFQWQLARQH